MAGGGGRHCPGCDHDRAVGSAHLPPAPHDLEAVAGIHSNHPAHRHVRGLGQVDVGLSQHRHPLPVPVARPVHDPEHPLWTGSGYGRWCGRGPHRRLRVGRLHRDSRLPARRHLDGCAQPGAGRSAKDIPARGCIGRPDQCCHDRPLWLVTTRTGPGPG